MAERTLADKMKLKAGADAAIFNAPPGYLEALRAPADVRIGAALDSKFDWVQIFVRNRAELEAMLPGVLAALKPESLLWISFPKGSSRIQTDLTRDLGWDSLSGADLKWINLISVDETWSAFSLRPYKPGEARQSFRKT